MWACADLVVFFPELPGLGVGLAEFGAGRAVVDRVVVVEHAAEQVRRVGAVADRMQLVRVPDEVEVVARHEERLGRHALEIQKLPVARDGVLQELFDAVVR